MQPFGVTLSPMLGDTAELTGGLLSLNEEFRLGWSFEAEKAGL
jgi:hypothetical protein